VTDALDQVLARSRELGFLGPGPIEGQRAHAVAFLTAIHDPAKVRSAVDLGAGGGIPGLVLAQLLPQATWVLLDSMLRRAAFLDAAVHELGLADRVRVLASRAEEAGRDLDVRATVDLVVSRSFGRPAVTAECAAPFLRPGGQLVVSEPPTAGPDRWPAGPLAELGLTLESAIAGPPHFVRLRQARTAPADVPRRSGTPRKAPLWS
jgi:16S rRNA (guanine527-N7)-methyltransferase